MTLLTNQVNQKQVNNAFFGSVLSNVIIIDLFTLTDLRVCLLLIFYKQEILLSP